MNIHKLIKDIKSELPHNIMLYEWEALNAFFDILCWKTAQNKDENIRKFARAYFEFMYGEPYQEGDWLDRVYQIIDGGLIKWE